MTDAISAQGTILAVSADPNWPPSAPVGGAVSFTNIAELGDMTSPALTRNPIETTTHNQSDERYIVGIRRKGEMDVSLNFIPTNGTHDHLTGLQKKYQDGTRNIYRLTWPDGTKFLFSGFVTNFQPTEPVDDKLTADVTLRPTDSHEWQLAS